MIKGLEALKTIRHIHDMECGKDESINKDFDFIEKDLKALEIIKKYYNFAENRFYPFARKTLKKENHEELNLLKEVLND